MTASSSGLTAGARTVFPVGVYVGQPDNSDPAAQAQVLANLRAFESALGVVPAYFDTFTNIADPISNWASQNGWQGASWAATPELARTTPILDLPLTSTRDVADKDYQEFAAVIGADVYSDAYNFTLYDFTTGKTEATFAQWASNPANLLHYYDHPAATQWGDDSSQGHSTTLQSLIDLAKATGKPLAIVETGADAFAAKPSVYLPSIFPAHI